MPSTRPIEAMSGSKGPSAIYIGSIRRCIHDSVPELPVISTPNYWLGLRMRLKRTHSRRQAIRIRAFAFSRSVWMLTTWAVFAVHFEITRNHQQFFANFCHIKKQFRLPVGNINKLNFINVFFIVCDCKKMSRAALQIIFVSKYSRLSTFSKCVSKNSSTVSVFHFVIDSTSTTSPSSSSNFTMGSSPRNNLMVKFGNFAGRSLLTNAWICGYAPNLHVHTSSTAFG